ncbi:hypothetical protein EAH76_23570 [Sphingomonas glacialis]|uniref:DUF995 domain-containing protein n=2 Tax=Sphingomonas glacialis TaxID=658225 RepID=A0A502FAF2_9SPHN|nr:hypothetical protein EAH76_23570 [Sphingomonas glacialis]
MITAPSLAVTKSGPLGLALGNVLVGDYGSEGKVTAAFDADGTVGMTFPDGTKRRQAWVADANYFCMIVKPGADGKMDYRCERNMTAGKKLGQTWQQVDSEGKTVTISIQPRPR